MDKLSLFKTKLLDRFSRSKNKFLIDGLIVGQAGVIAGALGYLFQILMANFLTVSEFASMAAAFGLIAFIGSPLVGVSLLVSRKTALLINRHSYDHLKKFSSICVKLSLLAFCVIYVGGLFCLEKLGHYLKLTDKFSVLLVIFLVASAPISTITASLLQGYQLFRLSAAITVLTSLSRLIVGVVMVWLSLGILSAFSASIFAQLVAISGSLFCCYLLIKNQKFDVFQEMEKNSEHFSKSYIFAVFVSGIALSGITQLDVFIVNYLFNVEDASVYISCIILAKVLLYIPNSITYVLYPLVAQNVEDKLSGFEKLNISLIISVAIVAMGLLVFAIFDEAILRLTYGNNFRYETGFLFYCALSVVPISLVFMIEHFLVAKGIVFVAWLLIFMTPLELVCVYMFQTSIWSIPTILGGFNTAILAITYLFVITKVHKTTTTGAG